MSTAMVYVSPATVRDLEDDSATAIGGFLGAVSLAHLLGALELISRVLLSWQRKAGCGCNLHLLPTVASEDLH